MYVCIYIYIYISQDKGNSSSFAALKVKKHFNLLFMKIRSY